MTIVAAARPRTQTAARPPPPETLSAALRARTREAHLEVERAFDLEHRVATRERYAALLETLEAFYAPAEAALLALEGWDTLSPPLSIAPRCRVASLRSDLALLGHPRAADAAREIAIAPLPSLGHGLGWLYVLEGSALGGQVIAHRARAALGAQLPLRFLSSAARPALGADWQQLRRALDSFGSGHGPTAALDVLTGAQDCFTTLSVHLEAER